MAIDYWEEDYGDDKMAVIVHEMANTHTAKKEREDIVIGH